MEREEFIEQIDALAKMASASQDEAVRKASRVLYTLQGTIVAGDLFYEPYFDQMQVVAVNMRNSHEAFHKAQS